jgi:cytochrome d ubiquinol oxidase subunit I
MTEIGRQPWTVFGLLTIEDSVSPNVTADQVWFSLIAFSTIYLILLTVLVYLFIRTARKGPAPDEQQALSDHGFDPYSAIPEKGGGQVVAP